MNETLKQWLEKGKAYFDGLSQQKKMLIGGSAGLIVLSGIVVSTILSRDPQAVLYSDLRPEESKAISKKLSEQNIQYQLSEDGATITVAGSQVYKARMELAKEGLPGQDVVGFEKFDGSTIGMSSYVQRIQYVRAVQGELTRSIQRLASVKTARVHISIPPKKTFLEEEDPPKASVVLELRPGQSPSKQETAGIANLVASAVEGLKVNQITIVDTKGSFLHRPEDGSSTSIPTALLEMQRNIETEYERRVEEMLMPVVGFGKVRAKVTAEIDAARSNTTEESYDPDKAVARTMTKTDEVQSGSRPNPIGIPGSRSNLPGTEVNNPPVQQATNSNEKNTTNANYAIPRKVQIVDKPSGSIKRLTVAVVVDGTYQKPQGAGQPVFTPRPEEELKRIQDLVANAVGFDQQRRDSITVSSMPFQNPEAELPAEVPKGPFNWDELSKHGVRNGVIGLVFLMFFFMVLRPFLKWITGADEKKRKLAEVMPTTVPKTVEELEAAVREAQAAGQTPEQAAESVLALAEGTTAEGTLMSQDPNDPNSIAGMAMSEGGGSGGSGDGGKSDDPKADAEQDRSLKDRILEGLNKSPKKGFRILQEWLDEDLTVGIGPQAAEG